MMIYSDFKSLAEVANAFPTEAACLKHLEDLRWNGFITSPFDPFSKVYVCNHGRYRCRNTGKYFNAKTGTIFYNSKIELQKWFMAIWLVSTSEKTLTSIQLGIDLGLTQKTAWFMLQRIRKYLGLDFPSADKEGPAKKDLVKKRRSEKIEQIDVVVEKDKMQMLEWLQMLKKS
jgi:hypothetical protein